MQIKIRINLLKQFIKKGKLLDYGCGNGWFLNNARKFLQILRFEPTKHLALLSSKIKDVEVETDTSKFKSNASILLHLLM